MYQPLPTPEEMALWDRKSIREIGIKAEILMENASREALAVLSKEYGDIDGARAYLFAGSGNNGGDAFALARHMHGAGAEVTIFHTKPKKSYRGATRYNLELAKKLGIQLLHLDKVDTFSLEPADIVVDGLLGTGFKGRLREDMLKLVWAINRLGEIACVLALDIPSGLDGITGKAGPDAVIADATATFGAAKLGLMLPEAEPYTGKLFVCDIGIPRKVCEENPASHFLITPEIMDFIPYPDPEMHKGKAGHVLVVGGSTGLAGAPQLAALAALRSGAGLATIACPGGLLDKFTPLPDIMTLPLGDGGDWTKGLASELLKHLDRFDSVVLGPGLGRHPKTMDFLREFLKKCTLPMLVDADALFHLAAEPGLIPQGAILTPHPGEMARLAGSSTAKIQADRIDHARNFAAKNKVVLALKGAGTIVADPDGAVCICPISAPNLAVAGSGDVLSGLTGTLMAQGLSPLNSACLGVYWHALCGEMLEAEYPARGNLASEIAETIPKILGQPAD